MAGPTFVNSGAVKQVTATTNAPVLPGSRVNGNLLLAWCRQVGSGLSQTLSVSAGWTICASISQGSATNRPMIIAYAFVTGSETAPTFTDTTTSILNAQVLQYTGSASSTPIGAVSSNDTNSGTTVTCPAITTTEPNSLAVNIVCCNISTGLSTPSGWSPETNDAGTTGESWISDKAIATSGSSSGSTSLTVTTSNYSNFILEIKSVNQVAYTISPIEGTYTLTGEVVTLSGSRSLSVVQGVYTLTGEATSTTASKSISVTQGTYSLTGESVSFGKLLSISITHGVYTLVGESTLGNIFRTLFLVSGDYNLTGRPQSLILRRLTNFVINCFQGVYNLIGENQGLNFVMKPLPPPPSPTVPVTPTKIDYDTWSIWSIPHSLLGRRRTRIKSGISNRHG